MTDSELIERERPLFEADEKANVRQYDHFRSIEDRWLGWLAKARSVQADCLAERKAREAAEADNAKLRSVMIAAAEEIQRHWDAHCDAEGYGPANLQHRLEEGIAAEYGYTAGAFETLRARAEAAEKARAAAEDIANIASATAARMLARAEAAEADARRYRRLREHHHTSDTGDGWLFFRFVCGDEEYDGASQEQRGLWLDAAIDADIAASKS